MKKSLLIFVFIILGLLFACSCDHDWSPATCEAAPYCKKCGVTADAGAPLGHTWSDANCTTPKTCAVCLKTAGDALEHKWIEATCESSKNCELCGLTDGEALQHDWIDATCVDAKTCTICNKEEGKALGHNIETWNTLKEATCAEVGLAEGVCLNCNESIQNELEKLDHSVGEWEIEQEATITADGKRIRKCLLCEEVVDSEAYELTETEYAQAYKAMCGTYSYEEIARNPDSYIGTYAKFTGEVIQVLQDTSSNEISYTLRVNITKTGNYYTYYTDTILVTYDADLDDDRILEDDIVTMYGQLAGDYTYETVMGSELTVPLFYAKYIDIN